MRRKRLEGRETAYRESAFARSTLSCRQLFSRAVSFVNVDLSAIEGYLTPYMLQHYCVEAERIYFCVRYITTSLKIRVVKKQMAIANTAQIVYVYRILIVVYNF